MGHGEGTLMAAETRWAPVVWAVSVGAAAGGAALLALSYAAGAIGEGPFLRAPLWAAAFLVWALLTASNALFVAQHRRTTVGMAPVAVMSLLPVSLAALDAGVLVPLSSALAIGAAAVTGYMLLWFLRLRRVYAHRPELADDCVAIVLGGAVRNGRPCRTLRRRLDAARTMAVGHPFRVLILTGGSAASDSGTEADAMRAYLVDAGVSATQLQLERRARNTAENIRYSCEIAAGLGLARRQLCVVSNDYHLYRAVEEGRRLGVELVAVAASTPLQSRLQQWCREVLTILSKR